jgi:hypothetical protein
MYENDGPLIRLARRAATRPFDPERKEDGRRGNAKSLLCDQAPCRSFGHPIVLDHRVLPQLHPKALTASAGTAWPAARTVPQVVTARLSGVSFSALLGGGPPACIDRHGEANRRSKSG